MKGPAFYALHAGICLEEAARIAFDSHVTNVDERLTYVYTR